MATSPRRTPPTRACTPKRQLDRPAVDQNQDAKVDGAQDPGYGNAGSIDQTQSGTNDNTTDQSADASALTKQFNVNVPISIFSWGSNGGGDSYGCGCGKGGDDVVQNNHAYTSAFAGNYNWTRQSVDQDQDATIVAPAKPAPGHGGYPQPPHTAQAVRMRLPKPRARPSRAAATPEAAEAQPQPCGCDYPKPPKDAPGSGSIDQAQSGSNDNCTDQRADAEATTKQANVNAADQRARRWGANNGSVDQANHAATIAGASNTNGTDAVGEPGPEGARREQRRAALPAACAQLEADA